jgi:hypothetical protein
MDARRAVLHVAHVGAAVAQRRLEGVEPRGLHPNRSRDMPCQLAERRLDDQPAAVDDEDLVDRLRDFGQVVAGDEDRPALRRERAQEVAQPAHAFGIEPVGAGRWPRARHRPASSVDRARRTDSRTPARGPGVGLASPSSIRSVVVLPAPFGPRNAVTLPASTSNDRSLTAMTSPKRFVRSTAQRTGATLLALPGASGPHIGRSPSPFGRVSTDGSMSGRALCPETTAGPRRARRA